MSKVPSGSGLARREARKTFAILGLAISLAAFVCGCGGVVHAVVLRANPPNRLLDDSRIQVTPVDYTDRPGAVAQAVFGAATTRRRRRRHGFAGRGSEPTVPEPDR